MTASRFVLIALAACHGQEPSVPPTTTSAPDAEVAALDASTAPQDSGASTASTASAADAAPAPTAQDMCVDSGQRVRFTVSVEGCGLKLGKTSTDEGRPGVVHLQFSTKSSCKQMKSVNVELMTNPLQQRRFQLIVEDDSGHTYADQMVSATSLPACKR
jgi:hypothetical protein